jgi:hypothetical protein
MQWITDGEKWRAWLVDYSAANSGAIADYRQAIASPTKVRRFPVAKRSVNGAPVPLVPWPEYRTGAL